MSIKVVQAHYNTEQQYQAEISNLFILLAAQPRKLVSNNNIKLASSLHNLFPLPCGHIVCNLSTIGPNFPPKNF